MTHRYLLFAITNIIRGRLRFLKKPFAIMDIITILISTVLVSLGLNSVRMSHHSETIFASGALRSLRALQFIRFIRVDRRGSSWKLIKQVGFYFFR